MTDKPKPVYRIDGLSFLAQSMRAGEAVAKLLADAEAEGFLVMGDEIDMTVRVKPKR